MDNGPQTPKIMDTNINVFVSGIFYFIGLNITKLFNQPMLLCIECNFKTHAGDQ